MDEPGLRGLPVEAQLQLAAQARVALAGGRPPFEEPAEAAVDPGLRAVGRKGTTRDRALEVPLPRRDPERRGKGQDGQGGWRTHHPLNAASAMRRAKA